MPSSRLPALTTLLAGLSDPVRALVQELLDARLIDEDPLEHLLQDRQDYLLEYAHPVRFAQLLYRHNLLTDYQREMVVSGEWRHLLMGNYRLLEVIGSGGMGTVYKAEHCLLKRKVAIKVVPVEDDLHPSIRQRFYSEMRALAELSHPNIVAALDAGEVTGGVDRAGAIYLVLELVSGGDLERYVQDNGPCSVSQACAYIRQAATGLHVAHDRHIIHRDIKPSNLLLNEEDQIKLVDFGLARTFSSRLTDPRALLGSLDYMPPEQSVDPSSVGKEADIYGLGATLFYLLTGEGPHPPEKNLTKGLSRLQETPARRVRDLRIDVPEALDDLIAQLLDRNPAKRPCSPLLVMHALTLFVTSESVTALPANSYLDLAQSTEHLARSCLLFGVEHTPELARNFRLRGIEPVWAGTVEEVHNRQRGEGISLVVVGSSPGVDPEATVQQIRSRSLTPLVKVLVVGNATQLYPSADDVLPPVNVLEFLPARCDLLLRWKQEEERAQLLSAQNELTAHQLQESLQARARDVREAHNALLFAMAKMAESREGETPGHLKRLQGYCRALAQSASAFQPWSALVDSRFLELLERCLPLHDIGKIGLPEDVLMKPGALNEQERRLIETHPVIGDRILGSLAREHGASLEFLGTARALVRHHHERYDGTGYPDRLVGDAIPAVARLTAIADVYDALRRDRLHKRAFSHDDAVKIILNRSVGQFDPILVHAFSACHPRFEAIFQQWAD